MLGDVDVETYRRVFAAQALADWPTADRLIARVGDPVLMGRVLFQRYMHPTGWRSSFEELSGWLRDYADHPGAWRIHRLALKRRPDGAAAPAAPRAGRIGDLADIDGGPSRSGEADREPQRDLLSPDAGGPLGDLAARIRRHIRNGDNEAARAAFESASFSELADAATRDRMAAEVARGFLVAGDDAAARSLAGPALARAGVGATLAAWIEGLAAYRQGALDDARRAFETLAAGDPGEELAAAGAYWAARLNLRAGDPARVRPLLSIAAQRAYGFYGLLARRSLGDDVRLEERLPVLSDRNRAALAALPEARRAVALAQVGREHWADAEFDGLSAHDRPGLAMAALRLAIDLGLPATQHRLSRELLSGFGERFDVGLYPTPGWRPEGGFGIDPALLFAVMRQESGFHARARSTAGARGPMQILPSTAAWLTGDDGYAGARRHLLDDPVVALGLGRDYMRHLLDRDAIDGNLFFALAAYNAGPGKLERWIDEAGATVDPLLFIETVPSRETRFFIEAVMANYWIYRLRLGGATPTLDMTASGSWPIYREEEARLAGNR